MYELVERDRATGPSRSDGGPSQADGGPSQADEEPYQANTEPSEANARSSQANGAPIGPTERGSSQADRGPPNERHSDRQRLSQTDKGLTQAILVKYDP